MPCVIAENDNARIGNAQCERAVCAATRAAAPDDGGSADKNQEAAIAGKRETRIRTAWENIGVGAPHLGRKAVQDKIAVGLHHQTISALG